MTETAATACADAPAIAGSRPATPYERIGGAPAVRALVDRFYDLVEKEPAYQRLRTLHADDLSPMRQSLSAFLGFWLGGPQAWRPVNGGGCVMSLHGHLLIDVDHAQLWMAAMSRAIAENKVDPALAKAMNEAMARMCAAMVNA